MTDLSLQRQYFSEEIRICANVRTAALDALAIIPREQFLPPGPWIIRGEGDAGGSGRATPDADPRHVDHNISAALDPDRQLCNRAPVAAGPPTRRPEVNAGRG